MTLCFGVCLSVCASTHLSGSYPVWLSLCLSAFAMRVQHSQHYDDDDDGDDYDDGNDDDNDDDDDRRVLLPPGVLAIECSRRPQVSLQ